MADRILKGAGAAVDLWAFITALPSGGGSLKASQLVKAVLVEIMTGVAVYRVSCYADNAELSFGQTLLLMMITGILADKWSKNYLDNVFDLKNDYKYYFSYDTFRNYDDIAEDGVDSIRDGLKNGDINSTDDIWSAGKKAFDNGANNTSGVPSKKLSKIKPSLPEGSKPSGTYAKEITHSYVRQNETANLFTSKGYKVEMLKEVDGGNGYGIKSYSNPDYLIEDKVFDCYAPQGNTEIDTIIRGINKKTQTQTHHIILNLDDFEGNVDDLVKAIKRKANPNGDLKRLEELLIVKDGKIIDIFD